MGAIEGRKESLPAAEVCIQSGQQALTAASQAPGLRGWGEGGETGPLLSQVQAHQPACLTLALCYPAALRCSG